MKLFSIVCESMMWNDAESIKLSGFKKIPFDTSPAIFSCETLWLMQSDDPLPIDMWKPHNYKNKYFTASSKFLSNRFKTRIISNFWPYPYDPTIFDKLVSEFGKGIVGIEPDNHQYPKLQEFLNEGQNNYEWLIYWSTIGHHDYRLPIENKGIPKSIEHTTKHWFDMIQQEIFPKVSKEAVILIHTDHQSARKPAYPSHSGFCFLPERIPLTSLTFQSLRKLEEDILCGKYA
jgi:hypothetical protein